jgi:hypothetical protein
MRTALIATSLLAIAVLPGVATAQESKKRQSSPPTTSAKNWPLCVGMLWNGQICRDPRSGKVCTVQVDTGGGEARMTDCK